jgi:O-antigen/teichoic acid export membrane protein
LIKEDIRKGLSSTIYNYLGLFFEKLVTVFVTVYVIRQLPIADYGLFNLFQDTIVLVGVIFAFGIPSLIERFLPELYERGLFEELKRWVKKALIARFLLGLLGALICLFGRDYLGAFLHSEKFTDLYPVFAIGLVFTILNMTSQMVLDTFLQQKRRNIIRIIVSTLRAGLYFAAIYFGYGLLGILWSFSISAVVGSLLFILTIRATKYPANVTPRTEGLGSLPARLKRYGGYSYANEMGSLILSRRVDNYLISTFSNTVAVGFYSFAARIVDMFIALTPFRVGTLIISTILFRQFTGDPTLEFLQRRFNLLTKLCYYLTLPLLLILVGLSRQVTMIIDPRYVTASGILALIAAFEIFNIFSWPIAWMAQSAERPEVQLYSKIGAIYNIISALILIPVYGPLGAAWATGTSSLMKNILMYIFLKRHLPLKFPWASLGKLSLAGLASLAVLVSLQSFVTGVFSLMFAAGVGVLSFVVASRMLRPFNPAERSSLEKAFGRRLRFV